MITGDSKTRTPGLLTDRDLDNEAGLPGRVDVIAQQLREWILGSDDWYSGVWVDYPELCRWHVYKEIGLIRKKEQRGGRNLIASLMMT